MYCTAKAITRDGRTVEVSLKASKHEYHTVKRAIALVKRIHGLDSRQLATLTLYPYGWATIEV